MIAMSLTDVLVGKVLEAIRDTGAYDDSMIIMSSDHGGFELEIDGKVHHTHGRDNPDCMEIFWACKGTGVAQGVELDTDVWIADTAAVVARFMELPAPDGWDCKVPDGVFI